MNTVDQVQCLVCWPHLRLKVDGARLASIEASGWASLPGLAIARRLPLLGAMLDCGLPLTLAHSDVLTLEREIYYDPDPEVDDWSSPLLLLSAFLGQVLEQTDAGARFEIWQGRRFETQVFVMPGTDLLEDLLHIASALGASHGEG